MQIGGMVIPLVIVCSPISAIKPLYQLDYDNRDYGKLHCAGAIQAYWY